MSDSHHKLWQVPYLMSELHPTKNTRDYSVLSIGSHYKIWWQCSQGHEWEATISNRGKRGSGCPYCSGRRAIPGTTDLLSQYPDIAEQLHPSKNGDVDPSQLKPFSHVKLWWQCAQGHEWEADLASRVSGAGCRYCSNQGVLAGYNDLLSQRSDLAKEWNHERNSINPDSVLVTSNQSVWWQCSQGHEWEATPSYRAAGFGGCNTCNGEYIGWGVRLKKGVNDCATLYPDLVQQLHPDLNNDITLDRLVAQSNKVLWWQCDLGHEWEAPLLKRTRGQGCPYCSNSRMLQGFNDISTTHPDIAREWHPTRNGDLRPCDITLGSHARVWWICSQKHEWEAPCYRRDYSGCPYCANQKLEIGFNDLASTHPHLSMEWHPEKNGKLRPTDIVYGSAVSVWWVCGEGHEWRTSVVKRSSGGTSCPTCMSGTSYMEEDLLRIVKSLVPDMDVLHRARGLLPTREELDIYIPAKQLAIEFNGLYWHSSRYKDRNHHRDKSESALKAGIQLVHIWEDDWKYRRDVVIKMLAMKLGSWSKLVNVLDEYDESMSQRVSARSTSVVILDVPTARSFLELNHVQGYGKATIRFGLMHKDQLVAVLCAKRRQFGGIWEISRYATSTTVRGGFTKLISYAERELGASLSTWITFSDTSISNGDLYRESGFEVDLVIPPDYSYIVGDRRHHKFSFRITRFQRDEALVFEPGLTESQLAELNGLHRIYDCGKIRWIKHL